MNTYDVTDETVVDLQRAIVATLNSAFAAEDRSFTSPSPLRRGIDVVGSRSRLQQGNLYADMRFSLTRRDVATHANAGFSPR
jgi:hypothetical protein